MLDTQRIQTLADTYSPQDIMAALVWQRRFNQFDGPQVMTDLAQHPDLWVSFIFTKPVYAPDPHGLSFNGVAETLLAMANYRPMPESSLVHFVPYPADTLYILTQNQDTIVAQLLDLGKQWQADEVNVFTGSETGEEDWEFRDYLHLRLQKGLWGTNLWDQERDAAIITYWWD